jgi:hypothetical protein
MTNWFGQGLLRAFAVASTLAIVTASAAQAREAEMAARLDALLGTARGGAEVVLAVREADCPLPPNGASPPKPTSRLSSRPRPPRAMRNGAA